MKLVSLSTPGQLVKAHAEGYERTRRALAVAGINTGTTLVAHAHRTHAEQERIFRIYYTPTMKADLHYPIDRRWWNGQYWYRRRGYASAAIPGTSNHGNGDTVDWQGLGGYTSATWKRAAPILRDHGWNNDEGQQINESWHWTRVTSRDNHRNTPQEAPTMQANELIPYPKSARDYEGPNAPSEITAGNAQAHARVASLAARRADFHAQQARIEIRANGAALDNMAKALAAVAGGEAFDEAKLLAGVRKAAEDGTRAALGKALDFDVTIQPRN